MARPRKSDPQTQGDTNAGISARPNHLLDLIDQALPKTSQAYGIMRRALVNRHLAPGSYVNEKLICDQLGISRTPLCKAILQLQSENLVSVVPNSGTYMSKFDLQSAFDGQPVRDALDLKVVRLAASRMTPQFERSPDFNMHQQKRLAADLDHDGFCGLDEAFHAMICKFGASARIWRFINGTKAQLGRAFTVIRTQIAERRYCFAAGAGKVLAGFVNWR